MQKGGVSCVGRRFGGEAVVGLRARLFVGGVLGLCILMLAVGLLNSPLALGADYDPLPDTGQTLRDSSMEDRTGDCENRGDDTRCSVTVNKNKSYLAILANDVSPNSDAWLAPSEKRVIANGNFDLHFHVNSRAQDVGSYQITINFDPDLVQVDTSKGFGGIESGADGFGGVGKVDNENGILRASGFDVNGVGPSPDLDMLIIHFKALDNAGTTNIDLYVDVLTDTNTVDRGAFKGQGSAVTIYNTWLDPSEKKVGTDRGFDLDLHVSSQSARLGAYDITITFDPSLVNVDTLKGSNGVEPGPNALSRNVYNVYNNQGNIHIVGFDINGVGPGSDLDILTIHFKTLGQTGTTNLNLLVTTLGDIDGNDKGSSYGNGSTITITDEMRLGDVTGDGNLNIVDALFIARYAVGLSVSGFNRSAGDVNCDGAVNIVDALFVARKAVGLEVNGWCGE